MNTDDFSAKTDRELEELFVREIAAWHNGDEKNGEYRGYQYDAKGNITQLGLHVPCFCSSADAVMPWLERWRYADLEWNRITESWQVSLQRGEFVGRADTFARAAVIALIRAKRAEKALP